MFGSQKEFRVPVGAFEKVSREQFRRDCSDLFGEHVDEAYDGIRIPARATAGSAGYDFRMPAPVTLFPGESIKVPTGIRVKIEPGWFLACFPRSGLGFKYRLQLDNTVGIIDSDYYGSDNEGHIFAKITNDSLNGKTIELKAGDAFMQGVFLPYGIAVGDDVTAIRNGGMGSTDKEGSHE